MHAPEWKDESQDKETDRQGKRSEHCQTFIVKDAHGAIKELVFPKALDLDRPKRERTIFSNHQLSSLEETFRKNQYLVGKDRTTVAKRLGLTETQVKVWFQNRRTKHKKDKERCGESNDLQAESKAAQNVLKLLEYKTNLSYKFLNPTSTHFDKYLISHATNIRSSKCADQLGMVSNKIILNGESSLGSSISKSEENGIESHLGKNPMAVFSNSDTIDNDLLWNKDMNSSNTLQQCSLASNSESLTSPPKNATNFSRHEQLMHSPTEVLTNTWNSCAPENTNSQNNQLLNSAGLQTESLEYAANLFRHSEFKQKELSHGGDQLQQTRSTITTDRQLLEGQLNAGNGQTLTCINKKLEKELTSHFCTTTQFSGPTHVTSDGTRDYYRIQSSECRSDSFSNAFPPVYTDKRSVNKCVRGFFDNVVSQNKIQSVCNPACQDNNVVTNIPPKRSLSLANYLQYQGNMPNLAHQHPTNTQIQGSQQHGYVPFRNIKHVNYYGPNIHGLTVNESAKSLEALQCMPIYHTYRDVYPQGSSCAHNFGRSPSSLLSHTSLVTLSTQYHGYPTSGSWSQTLPDCFQTE